MKRFELSIILVVSHLAFLLTGGLLEQLYQKSLTRVDTVPMYSYIGMITTDADTLYLREYDDLGAYLTIESFADSGTVVILLNGDEVYIPLWYRIEIEVR